MILLQCNAEPEYRCSATTTYLGNDIFMKFEMIFLTHDKQLHIRMSNHLYTQYLYDHLQKTELSYLFLFEVHKITTFTHCEQGL
jgi:hypothetical protein